MQDQLQSLGMVFIKGVIIPLVGIFVLWASSMMPAWIKAKVNNESVAGVLSRLTQLAFSVVQEIQQTVISGLGDKATETELLAARDRAIATLKSHLGDKGIKELQTVLGLDPAALEKLLVTYVESAVHSIKPIVETKTIAAATTTTDNQTLTVTEEKKS